jgi:lipoate-protein ligase B
MTGILYWDWLGALPYREALELQRRVHADVVAGRTGHTVLFLEHPPVYTFGKRGGRELLLTDEDTLGKLGADLVATNRGGLVTFHGPGQLVGYPILRLGALRLGLKQYVEVLTRTVANVLAGLGLDARADQAVPGVFVEGRKIGSIGVRLEREVTLHGFSLNVTTDLAWFKHIVACGLHGVEATSIAAECGRRFSTEELAECVVAELSTGLGVMARRRRLTDGQGCFPTGE